VSGAPSVQKVSKRKAREIMGSLRAAAYHLEKRMNEHIETSIADSWEDIKEEFAIALCEPLGLPLHSPECGALTESLMDYVDIDWRAKVRLDFNVDGLRDLINETLERIREGRWEDE